MINNLFVSFHLTKGKGDPAAQLAARRVAVLEVIHAQDHWAEIHEEFYFVSTTDDAQDLADQLRALVGPNDPLVVVDGATAYWHHLPEQVADYLRDHWSRRVIGDQGTRYPDDDDDAPMEE